MIYFRAFLVVLWVVLLTCLFVQGNVTTHSHMVGHVWTIFISAIGGWYIGTWIGEIIYLLTRKSK